MSFILFLRAFLERVTICWTASKGAGVSIVFVARNRFAVLDKINNQAIVKNLKNEVVKKRFLAIGMDAIFYDGTGNLSSRAEDRMPIFYLQQRVVLRELQLACC